MKIAIMQPYLFPYIGYFQLINAVDKFILFDDVNFIVKGWINRNRILVNGKEFMFTIPVKKASQNKLIQDIKISYDDNWQDGFLKTVEMNYKKAPFFKDVFRIIEDVIKKKEESISKLIASSIDKIINYLEISVNIIRTSTLYNNNNLKGQERILDICKRENATKYINLSGGIQIYSKDRFDKEGINLNFIRSKTISYKQFANEFIQNLSIIDVLAFNSKNQIKKYLSEYELI